MVIDKNTKEKKNNRKKENGEKEQFLKILNIPIN